MNHEQTKYCIGETGRVKAAGVSFEPLVANSRLFSADNALPDLAVDLTNMFSKMRHNPYEEIRSRFFPHDRGRVRAMTKNSPALLRPILKTDQGQGQFLTFETGETGKLVNTVAREVGYFIMEEYFRHYLEVHGYPKGVMQELEALRVNFANEDKLPEARLDYERLLLACEVTGIQLQREAQVGRDGLFFIRPAQAEESIKLNPNQRYLVQREIDRYGRDFGQLAAEAKVDYAKELGVEVKTGRVYPPIYFQADVQINQDGSVVVDQLQLPDVGLFLCALDSGNNEVLRDIQQKVLPLRDGVVETITEFLEQKYPSSLDRVYLITRPEVLERQEDVLEILEIQVLTQELAKRGIRARAISTQQALGLTALDVGLLLDINPREFYFEKLLKQRLVDDSVPIYPDPFLRLATSEMTGYQRVKLDVVAVNNLRALVNEVETEKERLFRQMMAVDYFLDKLGITTDVIHIHCEDQPTPIACLRHDIRGFHLALKDIKVGNIELRAIPITVENAVLQNKNKQALYSVFRFMAMRSNR